MSSQSSRRRKYSIRFTVGGMFLLATVLTGLVAISLQYYFSYKFTTESTLTQYKSAADSISDHISKFDNDMSQTADLVATLVETNTSSDDQLLSLFSQILIAHNSVYSLYVGHTDDSFYQVINLESSSVVRQRIEAVESDRWAVIKIDGEGDARTKQTSFLDEDLNVRAVTSVASNYYPSQRPWFDMQSNRVEKTLPYLFQHLKITGQTFSRSVKASDAVVGLDVLLSTFSDKIASSFEASDGAKAYLYRANGDVLASNTEKRVLLEVPKGIPLALSEDEQSLVENTRSLKVSNQNAWGPLDYAVSGQPRGYAIDVLNLISESTGLKFEYINGFTWSGLVDLYQDGSLDIIHSVQKHDDGYVKGVYSEPFYSLPFGMLVKTKDKAIKDLKELSGSKIAMLSGWSIIPKIRREFPTIEIIEVGDIIDGIKLLEEGEVRGLIDSSSILQQSSRQYFVEDMQVITQVKQFIEDYPSEFHMVMKPSDANVVAIINKAIAAITPEQREVLREKWYEPLDKNQVQNERLIPYPYIYELTENEAFHGKLVEHNSRGIDKFFYIQPVGYEGADEFLAIAVNHSTVMAQVLDRIQATILITSGVMCLLLPVAWILGTPIVSPIKQLREETRKIKSRQYSEVIQVDTRINEISELSKSVYDMAFEIKRHEETQEEFVESFIRLIAQAIDDKSAYTAGHCNRVPELGMMLVDAVEKEQYGTFADFKFANDDERREFRIAAWLHDCGKITQPEHIVDKGSKLEANYNRIHEVRMRFEVMWRDAELEALKSRISGDMSEEMIEARLKQKHAALVDDFEFVAESNVGGEFMSDDKVERIRAIAAQTWERNFDDRLGLSPLEEMRLTDEPKPLPVTEPLLSDKPTHIIERERGLEFNPSHNIKMDVPEHQYNLGEIYNLSISRGTLTAEDRFKINEHMISGIKMLENLPFPPELSRVPRYATTHHETLKGTGYPRKLSAEDLSIPERILVISDIFEALTASDRPYKKAKPVSVAIDILYKMALDEHIDIELFYLLLESGTYKTYADMFLPAEQNDKVDIEKYLSKRKQA